ncbi:TIGR02300 family protein [Acetobacteraceae bacterium AT-5844]|nr:TIGR02300 family protein [Acetobacteraceae bacterium AT-5844]
MAKPELGVKRTCVACGAKFYDMAKQPAVCPKCGTEQPAEQPRPRRSALPADDKLKKRAAPAGDVDADDVEIEDVDSDDALEEADDLEDGEDDLEVEVEVESDRDEEN